MSARQAARDTAARLRAAGIPDAELEAEVLTRHITGLSRERFFAGEGPMPDAAAAERLVERRLAHEPLAYLTGHREFYGRQFAVGPGVLIPRPETELLVELTLREIAAQPGITVVDVGTGSGCIAISIAMERTDHGMTVATDASVQALEIASRNVSHHAAEVRLIRGNLAGAVGAVGVVVANLPYIPTADISGLEPEVRDWEPRAALDGGEDGLDLVRQLAQDCGERLRPRLLALECGLGQASSVAAIVTALGADDVACHLDLAGIERVVTGRWGAAA